jgi:hypothetical protein
MRKQGQRHYAYEITDEAREAQIARDRDEASAADRRLDELCTQLLRKMPADHATLKATIRELRECHHIAAVKGGLVRAAHVESNFAYNRAGVPLARLVALVRTIDYRHHHTRKQDRRYIDLSLTYIKHMVEGAIFLASMLLDSPALRIAGDDAKTRRGVEEVAE